MPGIYIHIPFCRKACHYCNFHFSTSLHRKEPLLHALQTEIRTLQIPSGISIPRQIQTIYFGGGSPSILETYELEQIINAVNEQFMVMPDAEITLEANPDDINPGKLKDWKALGINRLSIGIQSFRDEDLQWMNRAHNARQAMDCIELAAGEGFNNLNIDLIYGTPTLPDEAWLQNLEMARRLGITHLSCYALTVEENTALDHFIKKGKVPPPPDERQAGQFEMLMDWADAQGWEHYEISNLCLPGHRSRHNSHYWTGEPYLGFGPSAHSFDGMSNRWMGIANNALYTAAWEAGGENAYITERLTAEERIHEKIMTGLRRMEGIEVRWDSQQVEGYALSQENWAIYEKTLQKYLQAGLCRMDHNRIQLTRAGKLQADAIAADLFI